MSESDGDHDYKPKRRILDVFRRWGVAAVVGLGLLCGAAQGADSTWTPQTQVNLLFPLDASWFDGSNWSNGVPGSGDRAIFNVSPPPNSPTQVYFGEFHKQFLVPPQTFTFSAGTANVSQLDVQAGTWEFNFNAFNAPPNAPTGNLTVTGSGELVVGSDIDGGGVGGAALTVTGPGKLSTNGASLGLDTGSSGMVNLSGSTCVWNDTASSGVDVGVNGHGTLAISGGAHLNAALISAAGSSGSIGDITINGGTLSGPLTLGGHGQASLTINSGTASLTNSNVALFSDSTATITVDGANSELNASVGLAIGTGGNGTLNVNNGGKVNAPLTVASGSGSVGNVSINGGAISGAMTLGVDGQASLTISSGSASIDANVAVNSDSTAAISVSGSNSSFSIADFLVIGVRGQATAQVDSGATVTGHGFTGLGALSGANGELTITGAGTTWTHAGTMVIGVSGTGSMTVSAGASLSTGDASSPGSSGIIAANPGSSGAATITDTNSVWDQTAAMSVGYHGHGTLTVENGGSLQSVNGYVGRFSDATGQATVTGTNSTWIVNNSLFVGDDGSGSGGSGSLVVSSGGAVFVGSNLQVGPQGTIDVTGGRVVVNSTNLPSAAGTLYIASGGSLKGVGTVTGHVVNDGQVLITETSRIIGAIDGAGMTQINTGGALTANHIVQGALVVGGTTGSPGLVTIDASDASGNPLGQPSVLALAGSLTPSGPIGADGIGSATLSSSDSTDLAVLSPGSSAAGGNLSTVPEPSTFLLILIAVLSSVGLGIARRRPVRWNGL